MKRKKIIVDTILQVYEQVYKPYENQTILTCASQYVQPKSIGTVTLRSKDPYDAPLTDPNFLSDPRDMEDILQGNEFLVIQYRKYTNTD